MTSTTVPAAVHLSRVGLALGSLAVGLYGLDLLTRSSCPQGYSRLLDVSAVLLPASAALAAVLLGLLVRAHRQGRHRGVTVAASVLLPILLTDLAVAASLLHQQSTLNGGCWAF